MNESENVEAEIRKQIVKFTATDKAKPFKMPFDFYLIITHLWGELVNERWWQ